MWEGGIVRAQHKSHGDGSVQYGGEGRVEFGVGCGVGYVVEFGWVSG